MIPLREIAHARSGDKGNSANVAVFARTPAAYAWLRDHLTPAAVESYFTPLGVGRVVRFEVPNLEALNFILPGVLGGGGSRSLRIDAQGKTLGMALLEMPVEADAAKLNAGR
ncbi:MAG: paaF [Verrucomicrobia bacterium]|nr:paaF [Verrucomicrobiota bacterium]